MQNVTPIWKSRKKPLPTFLPPAASLLTLLILSRLGTRGDAASSGLTKPRYAYIGYVYAPDFHGPEPAGLKEREQAELSRRDWVKNQ
jgi:hypothetical protein